MAPITSNRDLRQVLTTSMFSRQREVQDLVYNSTPITAILRENGAVRAYDGGPEIRIPLQIDKLDAQWFD
jgi:hypothetical protein